MAHRGIEIVDFFRPACNRKNLFMTNIVTGMEAIDVEDQLHCKFSQFGLLHEVQVFKSKLQGKGDNSDQPSETTTFYAFIKFYSLYAAARALHDLNGKCFIGEKCCKLTYAKRQKGPEEPYCLSVSQCVDLASYYMGFNGWSTEIRLLEKDSNEENEGVVDSDIATIRYMCVVTLYITGHLLSCQGFGAWEEKYHKAAIDPKDRITLVGKTKKIASQRAKQNAFSKLLLIILPNGKVTVEVNTTIPDYFPINDDQDSQKLLKVNELDKEPETNDEDVDDALHNLQDLQENIDDKQS
ncbi:hypothetical protein SNE40_021893 [Patella caerulea]|uniref:RRM domain-containing protein n=1 Tax=Patella caerulea TaxID=87958 RepID=A0AAN8GGY7_PATCE